MRKVMLGAIILVLCFCAVGAYDENTDYWYSNDDGILLDSLTPDSLFRGRYDNVTNILRSHNDFASEEIQKSNPSWVLKFEKYYPERNRTYLRTFAPAPLKINPILEKLEKKRTPEETLSCSDGPTLRFDCNYCVCMGGHLYVCTAKRCWRPDSTGIQVLKSYHEKRMDDCIEGEHIQSFDCNRCWCSGGKIICTKIRCTQYQQRRIADDSCLPDEPLSSPDSCNTCGCTARGEKYCTTMSCGIRPKYIKAKDVGCVPKTWYSLYGSSTCKECYCTDGKMAFCYMKLCATERLQYRGYTPQKLMSGMQTSSCNKGAVMFDECSKCICTYKKQWRCFTRLIDKCSGAGNDPKRFKDNKHGPGADNEVTKGYNEKITTRKRKTRYDKKREEIDNEYWNDPNNPDNTETETEGLYNFEDDQHDGRQPDGEKQRRPKQTNSPIGIVYDNIDVDDDVPTRQPEEQLKTVQQHTKRTIKSRKQKKTTPLEITYASIEVDDTILLRRKPRRRPRRPTRRTERTKRTTKRTIKSTAKKTVKTTAKSTVRTTTKSTVRNTTKSTVNTTRPKDDGADNDVELPNNCDLGELFTQGYDNNCQGCFCTAGKKWFCFSIKGPCRGNESKDCDVGTYEKNTQIPCSVCYCGADKKFICAVDEHCAQEIKSSPCETVDCAETCLLKKLNGFCHRDKCTCV